jgi:hypothetical protein
MLPSATKFFQAKPILEKKPNSSQAVVTPIHTAKAEDLFYLAGLIPSKQDIDAVACCFAQYDGIEGAFDIVSYWLKRTAWSKKSAAAVSERADWLACKNVISSVPKAKRNRKDSLSTLTAISLMSHYLDKKEGFIAAADFIGKHKGNSNAAKSIAILLGDLAQSLKSSETIHTVVSGLANDEEETAIVTLSCLGHIASRTDGSKDAVVEAVRYYIDLGKPLGPELLSKLSSFVLLAQSTEATPTDAAVFMCHASRMIRTSSNVCFEEIKRLIISGFTMYPDSASRLAGPGGLKEKVDRICTYVELRDAGKTITPPDMTSEWANKASRMKEQSRSAMESSAERGAESNAKGLSESKREQLLLFPDAASSK